MEYYFMYMKAGSQQQFSVMSVMNQVLATCWTCLLLSAFLCEPVLSKGGRGGSRGSSRGSPSRSSTAGSYRGGGSYGGTRSRFRAAGRSSPVRVASAAAAGAAVALTADKWYASAYRRNKADSSEEELDYYNRTNYFDALMSGSTQNGSSLSQLVSIIIATFSPKYGLLLDNIL
ncbi:shadow of prion protein isoform X1 [Chaetodon auriga]|uniref:shadow of prion protein isoform X1 n=2 Tax=Chaetodon auriga TaxID=39042 RepID=UPI004032ADE1